MDNERNPAHVLGWLTTSANYTVVTSFAPPEHRTSSREPVQEAAPSRPAIVAPQELDRACSTASACENLIEAS
jgi:hypothetical protein